MKVLFTTLRSRGETGLGVALHRLVGGAWRDRGFGDSCGYMLVAQAPAEAMIEVGPTPWDLALRSSRVAGSEDPDAVATNGPLHATLLHLLRAAR